MKWANGLYSVNYQIKSISLHEMGQWSLFIKPSNQINQSPGNETMVFINETIESKSINPQEMSQ